MYTPNFVERVWAEKRTRKPGPRIGLLAQLKTFQRLGYFVLLSEIPHPVLEHVASIAGYSTVPDDLTRYSVSSARRRHMLLIRDYVGVKEWGHVAELAMQQASQDAARTLEDLADIINVVLEQLIRQRYELPAFSILHRAAQHARATVIESTSDWSAVGWRMRLEHSWAYSCAGSRMRPRGRGTG